MRILVTGGAGLIGSHCAEAFCHKGWDVVVLDNLSRSRNFGSTRESVEHNWRFLADLPRVQRIRGDIRSEGDVRKALGKGVDAVIHAAAQPGVPSSVRMPREDFLINAFGTLNVLECLRRVSPKASFAYCSTNKVYGENVDRIPVEEGAARYRFKGVRGVDESMPVDQTGHTPYGASKYTGDMYCQEYARIYGLRTGVFRFSCVYGPRQFGFEEQGWVGWFVLAFLRGQPLTVYGDGKQVRDLLYVADAARAFESFISRTVEHGVFNVGGGPENSLSLLEFLGLLERRLQTKPKITFSDWRPSDQKVYVTDYSKAMSVLGWEPSVSAQEGLDRLIKWAKEHVKGDIRIPETIPAS